MPKHYTEAYMKDLVRWAGVMQPDSNESAGAAWLRTVDVVALSEDWPEDSYKFENALGSMNLVPQKDYNVWEIWTDLGMWSFHGELPDMWGYENMTHFAQIELLEAAGNLIRKVNGMKGMWP